MISSRQRPPRPERQWEGKTPNMSPSACRMATTAAHMSAPLPKDNPARSEPYRRLVASRSCKRCGIEGHSQCGHPNGVALGKGMAIKTDDRLCFPLCTVSGYGCHEAFDAGDLGGLGPILAEQWGKETRVEIIAEGRWPKGLELWDEDRAKVRALTAERG